jgi:hypothetical protein
MESEEIWNYYVHFGSLYSDCRRVPRFSLQTPVWLTVEAVFKTLCRPFKNLLLTWERDSQFKHDDYTKGYIIHRLSSTVYHQLYLHILWNIKSPIKL